MKLIDDIRRENLAALRDQYGTVIALANRLERSESQVSQWINGSAHSGTGKPRGMRSETARFIEEKCAKPVGWLDIAHGKASENTRPGPDISGKVPLISSVQAGAWADIANNIQPHEAADWILCPVKHGQHTFCLVVEGESMRNPGQKPSYDPGDIIFVDPDQIAQSGDRVVVRLDGDSKATFKQYIEEDGRKILKALNPDWKPRYVELDSEATICGTVIGKWVGE